VFTTRTGPHPEPDGFIRFCLLFVLKITFNIIHPSKPRSAKISRPVLEIRQTFCHLSVALSAGVKRQASDTDLPVPCNALFSHWSCTGTASYVFMS
jgi:hypothetical protein